MQTNLRKNFSDCNFNCTRTTFALRLEQLLSRISHFENRSLVKIYHLLAMATLMFSSCRKEASDPVLSSVAAATSADAHGSLTVDAGPGRKVVYPNDNSTKLFGSGGGNGVTYRWTQISGNSNAIIERPNDKNTNVSHLTPGVYTFSLTATDRSGNSRKATTSVTVLQKMTWKVDGNVREALVHVPGGSGAAPVIIAFHGHGGTDLGFAEKGFELEWPQAMVVYPQGLPTKSHDDKEGKKSGWQHEAGEVNGHTKDKDQDIKFFDAMLSTFQSKYHVNSKQIFVHGWSNGGSFIYDVLWPARGNKLSAISSAAATLHATKRKTPLPVMQIAGKSDPLVKFIYAQESVGEIRKLNKCNSNAIPWATQENGISGTRYWSPLHDPVIFLEYNGGHDYPADVAPFVVKFFKMVSRNETD